MIAPRPLNRVVELVVHGRVRQKTESAADSLVIALMVGLGLARFIGLITANGGAIGH